MVQWEFNFVVWFVIYLLYYKERRQLETFFTQFGPALPLTPDPPVVWFWKWIRWKDYEAPKNHNLKSVSAKNEFFFHPPRVYPPTYTRRAHATTLACTTRWYTPSCDAIFAPARPLTRRRAVPGLLGWNNALAGVDGAGSRTEKERARGRRGSSSFFFLVALGHGFCGSALGRWSRSAAAAAAVAAHPNSGGLWSQKKKKTPVDLGTSRQRLHPGILHWWILHPSPARCRLHHWMLGFRSPLHHPILDSDVSILHLAAIWFTIFTRLRCHAGVLKILPDSFCFACTDYQV
jgi:hypothetical protein